MNNPVAKHMNTYNKASVEQDRKKEAKNVLTEEDKLDMITNIEHEQEEN